MGASSALGLNPTTTAPRQMKTDLLALRQLTTRGYAFVTVYGHRKDNGFAVALSYVNTVAGALEAVAHLHPYVEVTGYLENYLPEPDAAEIEYQTWADDQLADKARYQPDEVLV